MAGIAASHPPQVRIAMSLRRRVLPRPLALLWEVLARAARRHRSAAFVARASRRRAEKAQASLGRPGPSGHSLSKGRDGAGPVTVCASPAARGRMLRKRGPVHLPWSTPKPRSAWDACLRRGVAAKESDSMNDAVRRQTILAHDALRRLVESLAVQHQPGRAALRQEIDDMKALRGLCRAVSRSRRPAIDRALTRSTIRKAKSRYPRLKGSGST